MILVFCPIHHLFTLHDLILCHFMFFISRNSCCGRSARCRKRTRQTLWKPRNCAKMKFSPPGRSGTNFFNHCSNFFYLMTLNVVLSFSCLHCFFFTSLFLVIAQILCRIPTTEQSASHCGPHHPEEPRNGRRMHIVAADRRRGGDRERIPGEGDRPLDRRAHR